MYISPNFEVNNDQDSYIVSPEQNKKGEINNYIVVERLVSGKTPIIVAEKIDKKRLLLAPVANNESMWLYPNGEIKIER